MTPDQIRKGTDAVEPVKGEIYTADDVKRDVKSGAGSENNDGRVYKTTGVEENAQIYTAAAAPVSAPMKADNSNLMITLGAAGAVVILGGTVLMMRKRKLNAK